MYYRFRGSDFRVFNMNSKHKISFIPSVLLRLSVGMLICSNWSSTSVAQLIREDQESRIESRLPAELLARPEIAVDVERLRSLRKNIALFGNKHPARAATEKQINELETKLSSYINPSPPQQKEVPPPSKFEGVEQATNAGPDVGKFDLSKIEFDTQARLVPAYPKLQLPELIAAGAFPALGLMWGVEYDPINDLSRVWQWSDSPVATKKNKYFQIEGRIDRIVFTKEFEREHFCYLLVSKKRAKAFSNIALLELAVEGLPPFSVREPVKIKTVFEANTRESNPVRGLVIEQSGKIGFLGEELIDPIIQQGWQVQKMEPNDILSKSRFFVPYDPTNAKLGTKPTGTMHSVYLAEYNGSALGGIVDSRLLIDPNTGSVNQSDRSGSAHTATKTWCKTSRGIQAAFIDTVQEPLVLDGFGVLLTIEIKPFNLGDQEKFQDSGIPAGLPDLISKTGWYDDLKKGRLSSAFLNYVPVGSSKFLSEKISLERFLMIPEGKKIKIDGTDTNYRFPTGSIFLQNFFYTMSQGETRRLKTLGLIRTDLEWIPFVYNWGYGQDDAKLESAISEALPIATNQNEIEFLDLRKQIGFGNCLQCHQSRSALGGLGMKESRVGLAGAPEKIELFADYLLELGYLDGDAHSDREEDH